MRTGADTAGTSGNPGISDAVCDRRSGNEQPIPRDGGAGRGCSHRGVRRPQGDYPALDQVNLLVDPFTDRDW